MARKPKEADATENTAKPSRSRGAQSPRQPRISDAKLIEEGNQRALNRDNELKVKRAKRAQYKEKTGNNGTHRTPKVFADLNLKSTPLLARNGRNTQEAVLADTHRIKWKITTDSIKSAVESGKLPHEILLDIARGVPVPHPRIDIDTGEIDTVLVVPTLDMRIDAAKVAAPFYAAKFGPKHGGEGGGGSDDAAAPVAVSINVVSARRR